MNKSELIEKISRDAGIKKGQSTRAVKAVVQAIRDTIKSHDKISLSGLGTFKVKPRKARKGRDPQKKVTIDIPAGFKVSFKPSLSLRKLVKG